MTCNPIQDKQTLITAACLWTVHKQISDLLLDKVGLSPYYLHLSITLKQPLAMECVCHHHAITFLQFINTRDIWEHFSKLEQNLWLFSPGSASRGLSIKNQTKKYSSSNCVPKSVVQRRNMFSYSNTRFLTDSCTPCRNCIWFDYLTRV